MKPARAGLAYDEMRPIVRVTCVLTEEEAFSCGGDVFVFPEGVSRRTLSATARAFPSSLVVGAYEEGGYCYGALVTGGRNHLDYRKIGSDGLGHARGTNNLPRMAVYESATICAGVSICMDVNEADFISGLQKRVRASNSAVKLLCIPGDMMAVWFSSGLNFSYQGMHVALCNNTRSYQDISRRASFVAGPDLQMLEVQKGCEPISCQLI